MPWEEDQLEEYLAHTHKHTRPANKTPVYGAVAMGRKIGFYKYNHNSKQIRAWRPASRSSFDDQMWSLSVVSPSRTTVY